MNILPIINKHLSIADDSSHVWHVFVIRTSNRDKLQQYLLQNNVQSMIHYPIPPHKQEAYKEWDHLNFTVTEKIHHEVLSLPISPILSDMDVKLVVKAINNYCSK